MTVPYLPFAKPAIDEATIAGVVEVLRNGWLTGGPKVRQFEEKLSDYFGGRPVRTFNSGTGTMEIALRIAGIGAGDEVVTTPISWVATANVILTVGATPVFVDIDLATRNIDLGLIEAAITPRTRAIMPVFLAGLPMDMDKLYAIAKRHQLRVIEDAAQAFGSSWKRNPLGSFGDLVSFSFQANKNITTGEGGCLVLNTAEEAFLAEQYRLQGVIRSGFDGMEVNVLGGKFNMSDIAAAIGIGQLAQLEALNRTRLALARHYFSVFGEHFEAQYDVRLPPANFTDSNWHMFQIVLPETIRRTDFIAAMKEREIGVGVHYPPIHLFALYRRLGFREGMFPVAERIGRQIVTLPLFSTMTEQDIDRVVDAVKSILDDKMRLK
ncbi:dTDP-4-amino-4,6-dideoxygalactose transaminase [Paucimonas lemoignei]|uniref:dTDP-4-amino-4,6-dideoxygalactose transaminase n=1 Tax=Paucimonas lemoignei TaxID=29443 RepID=A0A4R3I3K3_PAULE|nr:DegT/DnrJ/EryC1/StrS aminotransferase family protein [Paucimonas lemoignei]TCS39411.1 dTDP-4-amino-4,6-dideoxygalactose transaminase [Paucimonas lemoignei]